MSVSVVVYAESENSLSSSSYMCMFPCRRPACNNCQLVVQNSGKIRDGQCVIVRRNRKVEIFLHKWKNKNLYLIRSSSSGVFRHLQELQ